MFWLKINNSIFVIYKALWQDIICDSGALL